MGTVRVAMVGLGRMGLPMARHMAEGGYKVVAFDVSEDARERAVAAGLTVVATATDLVANDVELVCSSLPATADVEAAYFGKEGIAAKLAAGTVCADLSTISITASRDLARRCHDLGLSFLDTPVSGTSIHAEAGSLVIMAGGDGAALERARPALECFASRLDLVGGNGAGLELKLITNRLLTTHLAAIAEAIVSLEHTQLPIPHALELLRAGAVPRLLEYKAGPLADRDYRPQFTVDLMAKDLRLADEDLASTPLATAAREIVEAASGAGLGDADLAAIMEIVESRFQANASARGNAAPGTNG